MVLATVISGHIMGYRKYLLPIFSIGLGISVLYFSDPASSGVFPPCPLWSCFGLYCPGCGAARAIHQLVHGNFYAAFRLNPLLLLTLPVLVYIALTRVFPVIGGYRLPMLFQKTYHIWMALGILLFYTILRNVSSYPFSLLAPWP